MAPKRTKPNQDQPMATRSTMFERHHLKALNLGLVLYLCFGAVLFDWLSFDKRAKQYQVAESAVKQVSAQRGSKESHEAASRAKTSPSLDELRLGSVRRMWNITNQLNILYESNWTLLVLDELVEFERQLVKALAGVGSQQQQDDEQEIEVPDLEFEAKDDKARANRIGSDEAAKSAQEVKRSRSIKRSIVHSLATIITIGSPQVLPQNRTAKLATMLYAAFGVPLLFYTVLQTGKQLAHSTLNSLLILRHYCFALPLHYLCCSCSPYLCFRLLSWCCCCCCCGYLLCPASRDKGRKCCDKGAAPKLRLHQRRQLSRRFVGLSSQSQLNQAAYVIKMQNEPSEGRREIGFVEPDHQSQKSVRFVNRQPSNDLGIFTPANQRNSSGDVEQLAYDDELELADEQLHSFGLLVTSLVIFALYFSLGAYLYSRYLKLPLIDASYECYSMLSTSKLPDSFGSTDGGATKSLDPSHLYETLKSTLNATKVPKLDGMQSNQPTQVASQSEVSNEALIWQTIYLVGGLYLISMCVQFAKFWSEGREMSRPYRQNQIKKSDSTQHPLSNGQVPAAYLSGSFGAPGSGAFLGSSPRHLSSAGELAAPSALAQNQGAGHHHMVEQCPNPADRQLLAASIDISPSQHSEPLNLGATEIYLVNSNGQQQTSDMSYASDRSTDRGSLCLHHQAAVQGLPLNGDGSPSGAVYYGPKTTTVYAARQPSPNQCHQQQKHRHLYLTSTVGGSGRQALNLQGDYGLQVADVVVDEEDDEEMDRMLKACVNNGSNKMRPSSSLVQLAHQNGGGSLCLQQSLMTNNGFGSRLLTSDLPVNNSATLGRIRPIEAVMINGAGERDGLSAAQDTASSTMSSSTGSRTVKISSGPRRQHLAQNGVGFVLDNASKQ